MTNDSLEQMTAELNYYTVARGFTRSLLIYCVFSILEKTLFVPNALEC